MELVILPDAAAVAEEGARYFARALADEPDLSAVIATGNSPIALYARLAALQAAGLADARAMTAFQLDTYVGVTDDDPRSLWGWMHRAFVVPLGLTSAQIRRFDGMAPDGASECARMDAAIAAMGGLGLAVLGLGPNGHLGFNEPPSAPDAPSRPVALTLESVRSNAIYWGGEDRVPKHALTLGMAQLLTARRILLVVTGAHKHAILRATVTSPSGPGLPASLLQDLPQVTVMADRAAWEGA